MKRSNVFAPYSGDSCRFLSERHRGIGVEYSSFFSLNAFLYGTISVARYALRAGSLLGIGRGCGEAASFSSPLHSLLRCFLLMYASGRERLGRTKGCGCSIIISEVGGGYTVGGNRARTYDDMVSTRYPLRRCCEEFGNDSRVESLKYNHPFGIG